MLTHRRAAPLWAALSRVALHCPRFIGLGLRNSVPKRRAFATAPNPVRDPVVYFVLKVPDRGFGNLDARREFVGSLKPPARC